MPRSSRLPARRAKGYSRCFVDADQNEEGGAWLSPFYLENGDGQRLLDGDKYYVRIVS